MINRTNDVIIAIDIRDRTRRIRKPTNLNTRQIPQ